MKSKIIFFLFSITLISIEGTAQIGGKGLFSFLDLSTSARIAALGGTFIAVHDNDPNPATQNPSLLNSSMSNMLSFSGVKYFADVKGGDASFTRSYEKIGTFQAAVHYINYGTFKNTDIYGNVNGDFTASDLAFQMGWGYQVNPFFTIGADMKFIYSHYESYSSTGIVGDLGVTYIPDSSRGITASLLARNIGGQMKRYDENKEREPVNSEVIVGLSKKFSHAPFRVIITYRHLEKFDFTYLNPLTETETDPITGEKIIKDITFFDKFSRHLILGTELVFSTNFQLRFAYNFQRRAELKLDNAAALTGMSLGFGMKVNRFYLAYGYAAYHVAGGTNHITVSTNPYDFFRKKSSGD